MHINRLLHDERCPMTTNPSGNAECDCAVAAVNSLQAKLEAVTRERQGFESALLEEMRLHSRTVRERAAVLDDFAGFLRRIAALEAAGELNKGGE
jgi:hypothetical protein